MAERRGRTGRPWLAGAVVLVGVALGSSEAAVDMTGDWYATVDAAAPTLLHIVQTGSSLDASGFQGTIDSTTGAFTLFLGPVITPEGCGVGLVGVVGPEGDTFTGTAYQVGPPPGCQSIGCFCSGSTPIGPLYGTRSPCGNGAVDAGEECDDGQLAPGDCCSLRCRAEPAGSGCGDDGNVCTDDACDGSGTCVHAPNSAACDSVCAPGGTCSGGVCVSPAPAPDGTPCEGDGNVCSRETCDGAGSCLARGPVDCGPCRTCSGGVGCLPSVRPYCAEPGRGTRIELRNGGTDAHDALAWRWADQAPGEGFGDPTTSTDYELCVFTTPDAGTAPLLAFSAAGGSSCGERPCWRATARGFRYRSTAGGLSAISLRAAPGKGQRISARGRGASLGMPASLDLQGVLVQLGARDRVNGYDSCWQATYLSPTHPAAARYVAVR
jgi:cysteine-rich repeat protein